MEEIVAVCLKEIREEMRADHEEMWAKVDAGRKERKAGSKSLQRRNEGHIQSRSRRDEGLSGKDGGKSGTNRIQIRASGGPHGRSRDDMFWSNEEAA
jgi:hypothetical protein